MIKVISTSPLIKQQQEARSRRFCVFLPSPDLATEWPWQADGIHGSRKELGGPGSGKAPHPSSSPPIPSPPLFASPSPLPALDRTTNLILHLDSFVPDE